MTWILLIMLGAIAGSILIEQILPQATKDRLGAAICWGMMAITMVFLGIAALGLIVVTYTSYIAPLLA
jgi:hypothetical protein